VSGPCRSSSVAGRPLRPATRRSLGEPLPHQLADRPRTNRKVPGLAVPSFSFSEMPRFTTCGINPSFPGLSPAFRNVVHVLRTRSPLSSIATAPFDLHVLSTPPAFVLSQNQTLQKFCHHSWWLDGELLVYLSCEPLLAAHYLAFGFFGNQRSHRGDFASYRHSERSCLPAELLGEDS
jgi:hypothetical protein